MNVVVREMPNAAVECLRFQVGVMETRQAQKPVYEKEKVTTYTPDRDRVQVFHLLGFGATREAAAQRAGVAL